MFTKHKEFKSLLRWSIFMTLSTLLGTYSQWKDYSIRSIAWEMYDMNLPDLAERCENITHMYSIMTSISSILMIICMAVMLYNATSLFAKLIRKEI